MSLNRVLDTPRCPQCSRECLKVAVTSREIKGKISYKKRLNGIWYCKKCKSFFNIKTIKRKINLHAKVREVTQVVLGRKKKVFSSEYKYLNSKCVLDKENEQVKE